jgi:uncharacterized protein (TIGR02147 family)
MTAPDIYTYLDYRQFLRDWFNAKKAANPRYSHRVFARKADQRSPSMLIFVMDGKRNLTPKTVASFAKAMGLDEAETRFFGHLIQHEQAEMPRDRAQALDEILKTTRFREARRLDSEALEYFVHWYFPAIHELAHRPDFQGDAAWIAKTLVPSISEPEAQRALESLLELGLLAPDEAGIPRPTAATVTTPHEATATAAHAYHEGMLQRALEAIGTFPRDERHILGVTAAIPESMVPKIKTQLNELQKALLSATEQGPKERVF